MTKYKTAYEGTLCYIGESQKAYKVASLECFTTDIAARVQALNNHAWIPKASCTNVTIQSHEVYPLQQTITLRVQEWVVNQNEKLEDWLDQIEVD